MNNKELIIKHIKETLNKLEELGSSYSDEKINKLAENLINTNKSLEEVYTVIDNKFSNQARKIKHNNHLNSLKEYYLQKIDKMKPGNNCYLLSYSNGGKVLEQANIKDKKDINLNLTLVTINDSLGYKKPNTITSEYELIMSDIAYLLDINYAKTYRVFDAKMNPKGIVNEALSSTKERFLNYEEMYKFIKEESQKFNLKNEIIAYHDINKRKGLTKVSSTKEIFDNIEYIIKCFNALPDITKANVEKLKKEYLNIKIFELLTNSLKNNLTHYGIIIKKDKNKYKYELSPTFNKGTTFIDNLKENETICNFYIVDKKELLSIIINNYYEYIKELMTLIVDNRETLSPLINQLIKEHLEYDEYNKYSKTIDKNYNMIVELLTNHKNKVIDTDEDKRKYIISNNNYTYRIAPYLENYDYSSFNGVDENNKSLLIAVAAIMIVTIIIIGAAILIIS